jgi:tetratricopeptide (TPR) repeat protein
MTICDPFQHDHRLPRDALLHFTNRERAIETLESYLNAPINEKMKVLVFYGVGGIGKTALQLKMCDQLRNIASSVPFARFNMENIGDKTRAYREVLLNLRSDFERNFDIKFPRFDICWAVIVAYEGGSPEPLVRINPALQDALNFATSLLQAPLSGLTGLVDKLIRRNPAIEQRIRHVFKTEDVIHLRERAMRDDTTLPDELIRYFIIDMAEGLPVRDDGSCRGIIFLDTYEALWTGRERGASAQARLLDDWVRELVSYCLHPSVAVLPVICGRDRLVWIEDDPTWQDELDQNLLDGLSARDSQLFLSQCGIGSTPEQAPTPLQEAIIKCCREQLKDSSTKEMACHPLYLALCAEIVLNNRKGHGSDPAPSMFSHIPSSKVSNELATRFLKSLNNRAMEMWVSELSITPHFDEEAALSLDDERKYHNGRAGWEQLKSFSFMEPQADGSYRFHKIMGEVLRNKLEEKDVVVIHKWFCSYWKKHNESALSWYHFWMNEPENVLKSWNHMHENALEHLQISRARELVSLWNEAVLDEYVRKRLGDELWAVTQVSIGNALCKTPRLTMVQAITTAIGHYNEALKIYTETEFPMDWAMTQNNLGNAYSELPTGDRGENLEKAIRCYEAALKIYTETEFPMQWAGTQNNLGNAYKNLPTGDRGENLEKAIRCYEAALRIFTEIDYPYQWSIVQKNLRSLKLK